MSRFACLLVLLLPLAPAVHAGPAGHPPVLVEEGACPGEGCEYGTWRVLRSTVLRAQPSTRAKVVGRCEEGTKVKALDGRVRTVAGRFVVSKPHDKFLPGDVIWVYTYRGEGNFTTWFRGKLSQEDLGFSPWGGATGARCEIERRCWGRLDQRLRFTWWVHVQNADGVTGWTNAAADFAFGSR